MAWRSLECGDCRRSSQRCRPRHGRHGPWPAHLGCARPFPVPRTGRVTVRCAYSLRQGGVPDERNEVGLSIPWQRPQKVQRRWESCAFRPSEANGARPLPQAGKGSAHQRWRAAEPGEREGYCGAERDRDGVGQGAGLHAWSYRHGKTADRAAVVVKRNDTVVGLRLGLRGLDELHKRQRLLLAIDNKAALTRKWRGESFRESNRCLSSPMKSALSSLTAEKPVARVFAVGLRHVKAFHGRWVTLHRVTKEPGVKVQIPFWQGRGQREEDIGYHISWRAQLKSGSKGREHSVPRRTVKRKTKLIARLAQSVDAPAHDVNLKDGLGLGVDRKAGRKHEAGGIRCGLTKTRCKALNAV